MIARLLFGRRGDFFDRHQDLLVAGIFLAICTIDYIGGLV